MRRTILVLLNRVLHAQYHSSLLNKALYVQGRLYITKESVARAEQLTSSFFFIYINSWPIMSDRQKIMQICHFAA